MKVLIIDNYDSFTYNLYQYVGEILSSEKTLQHIGDFSIIVKRNNEISLDEIKNLQPERIIISPGPGSPDDEQYFGICSQVIKYLGKTTPILGVCLGMQGIVHAFGGKIIKATLPMHGKTSPITHNNQNMFTDIPQQLEIMRYHSLIASSEHIPTELYITAVVSQYDSEDQIISLDEALALPKIDIMGIKHKKYPIQGIQFHPESFGTEGGKDLIRNFLV